MDSDIDSGAGNYTYNELTNNEKEWLLRNGYEPGELPIDEVRRLMQEDADTDMQSEALGEIGDERDGTDADAS